ncbi:MAG: hypothetical protein BroJett013_25030 [Alphaproteobacteria bacterium]|nr:MAG: hypothetical protein BroJett013_25030 [Alphaproteobacteria bacterium]
MKDLDRRLAALGRVEIDRDLGCLERDVWRRIDAQAALRPLPRRWMAALCCGAAMIFSVTGASLAVAAASGPVHAEAFSLHAPLAPSTLLAD